MKPNNTITMTLPNGIQTKDNNIKPLLSKDISQWSVGVKLLNSFGTEKKVCLLPAIFGTNRPTKLQKVGDIYQYETLYSGLGEMSGCPNVSMMELNDSPFNLSLFGLSVDAVVSTPIKNTFTLLGSTSADTNFRSSRMKADISWDMLRDFIKFNPVIIDEIIITSNRPEMFDNTLEYADINPFEKPKITSLSIQDYYAPNQYVATKVVIKTDLFAGANTYMATTIPANTVVTITFKIKSFFDLKKHFSDMVEKEFLINFLKSN